MRLDTQHKQDQAGCRAFGVSTAVQAHIRAILFSEIALRTAIRVAETASSGTYAIVARPAGAFARYRGAHLIRSVVEQPQRSSA